MSEVLRCLILGGFGWILAHHDGHDGLVLIANLTIACKYDATIFTIIQLPDIKIHCLKVNGAIIMCTKN